MHKKMTNLLTISSSEKNPGAIVGHKKNIRQERHVVWEILVLGNSGACENLSILLSPRKASGEVASSFWSLHFKKDVNQLGESKGEWWEWSEV